MYVLFKQERQPPLSLRPLPSPELIRVATCAAGPHDHDAGGLKAVACHPTPGAGAVAALAEAAAGVNAPHNWMAQIPAKALCKRPFCQ